MEADPHDDDLRNQIREAFRVFDEQDLGYIPADNLTRILTSIGDKLTKGMKEQLEQMISSLESLNIFLIEMNDIFLDNFLCYIHTSFNIQRGM